MSTLQYSAYLGQEVLCTSGKLQGLYGAVVDVKSAYGSLRFRVAIENPSRERPDNRFLTEWTLADCWKLTELETPPRLRGVGLGGLL